LIGKLVILRRYYVTQILQSLLFSGYFTDKNKLQLYGALHYYRKIKGMSH